MCEEFSVLLDLDFAVMIPAVIRQYFTTCLSFYFHPYISSESPQTCKGAFFVDIMIHLYKLICAEYNSPFMDASRLYMEGWSEDCIFH